MDITSRKSNKIKCGIIKKRSYYGLIIIAMIIVSGIGSLVISINFPSSCPPLPDIEWTEKWGGSNDEILYGMVNDTEGFFYLAGETWNYGNGSCDIFLVKMNKNFSQYSIWGGVETDEFNGMVIDSNDNIYIVGSTLSYGGEKDIFLLKYNKNLIIEWNRTLDLKSSDSCCKIALDSLNNVYITGLTNDPYYDVLLAKYNKIGGLEWSCTWNTSISNITEKAFSLVVDSSDQIFLGVNTNRIGSEWCLLKYNSSGTLLLNASYNKYIPLELLVIDSLDNLYAAGSYNNMFLSKLDSNGNVIWNITCIQEILYGSEVLALDPFDNIVLVGNELINASAVLYGYNMTDYDTYLMKFNSSGVLNWNRTISYGNNIFPEVLEFDPLGNIFIGGSLELIATKSLSSSIIVYDYLGNPKRREGGGAESCKGIYAESIDNFFAAVNSLSLNEVDYDIELIKYIEQDVYCPFDPFLNLLSMIIFNGLFYISCIIGVIYLLINRKKRLKE